MKLKTEIIVITDRSGSMVAIANDVIGGYNRFLADQKAQPGEARMTYTQFDTEFETVFSGKPIKEAPELTDKTFVPRGGTALLDAMGRTLSEQGARIATEKWAELVIVCVITDGEENSSHEYSKDRIKEMTAHAEKNGWKFIFLAANQDAFATARSMGTSAQYAGNFAATAKGTAMAYSNTSGTVSSLRAGNNPQNLVQTP
jgi:Mg-chelatase subunit ChlD